MGPCLQTISILSYSPGRAKERRLALCLHRSFQRSREKERGPHEAQTTQLGPPRPIPPSCTTPGSRRGRSGAETRGTQGLSQHSLPSCPRWRGAQQPGGARSGGESLVPRTAPGRLLAAPLEGPSAHPSRGQPVVPAPASHPHWLRGAHRVPGGHSDTKRSHQLSLQDLFTEAALHWHVFLDSQVPPIRL